MASNMDRSEIRQIESRDRKMERKQQIDRRRQVRRLVRELEEKLFNKIICDNDSDRKN